MEMTKTPANNGRDGKEYADAVNKGTGMSKSSGGKDGSPSSISKMHMRSGAGLGTEFSAEINKGDGMSK